MLIAVSNMPIMLDLTKLSSFWFGSIANGIFSTIIEQRYGKFGGFLII